jgi:hypothetical protein
VTSSTIKSAGERARLRLRILHGIDNDDHVERAGEIARRGQLRGELARSAGGQHAAVDFPREQVAIGIEIEIGVAREEHLLVPARLPSVRRRAGVGDGVRQRE